MPSSVLNTPSQYFYWDDIAGKQALEEDQGLCASRARRSMIKRTPSEIPPPVARSFMSDTLRTIRFGEIGPDLFRDACEMGLEGLVSKRRDHTIKPAGRSTGSK